MKYFLIFIVLAFGCRTSKTIKNEASKEVIKNDSNSTTINAFEREKELKETTPASSNAINMTVGIDSNGLVAFESTLISGTDSLVIKGKGKDLSAKSNCAAKERSYIEKISFLEKELKNTRLSMENISKKGSETKEVEKLKTPFYNWVIIGFLLAIIVFLIIRNLIK